MIDADGFRPNVGIILTNEKGQLFWARRRGQDAWQFPQGGIRQDETPHEALFRELYEEIGLLPDHVQVTGWTRSWMRYRLPNRYIRRNCHPVCVGQKQIWYMLRFLGDDDDFDFCRSEKPEFDRWRWVHYWHPLREVVFFKRGVYLRALREFAPLVAARHASTRARSRRRSGSDSPISTSVGRSPV